MLLAACGGDNSTAPDNSEEGLRERAKPAEAHLVEIRDAIVAYHGKHKKKPETITDLEPHGITNAKLADNDDYSELGYGFYNVEFGPEGKLTRCWLIATPMSGRGCLQVRMNGVNGEFDYAPSGQEFGVAPSDPPQNK
jgi:hypothetical protein